MQVDVNGEHQHAVFKFVKGYLEGDISWNFNKFLIDRNGKVRRREAPNASGHV